MKRPAAVFGVLLVTAAIAWWLRGSSPGGDSVPAVASDAVSVGESGEPRRGHGLMRDGDPFSTGIPTPSPGVLVSAAPPTIAQREASMAVEAQPYGVTAPALVDDSAKSPDATAKSDAPAPASDIDKTACEAVARTLRESRSIFDLTPTFVVHYSRGDLSQPLSPYSGFIVLNEALLGQLCTGVSAYDPAYPVEFEFVAISETAHERIVVGNHWISDGTILSPLSDSAYILLTTGFVQGRRRLGSGQNMRREVFDRILAKRPQALFGR